MIVLHLIDREYTGVINQQLATDQKIVLLANAFCTRLTSLIAHWVRVGFCQGNFNSDNCAAGGFTLDYGPYGFCELFDPQFQPWTGGGNHYSFFNQPAAAERNFVSFCTALKPLLIRSSGALQQLEKIQRGFAEMMQTKMDEMWTKKLGIIKFDKELFDELLKLMIETSVDYTIFFQELSAIPNNIIPLKKSFYTSSNEFDERWVAWLEQWKAQLNVTSSQSQAELSTQMRRVNPKYILREWIVAPSYKAAATGDYALIHKLQSVMTQPYVAQSEKIEQEYDRRKPSEFFQIGGVSHYSCSS